MVPTNKSLNIDEKISNTTKNNQFVYDIGTGYKILKPPEPNESVIGTAKSTTFYHKTK